MKKYMVILCNLLFTFCAWSTNLKEAEDTFQKGDFATAKNLYSQLLENSAGSEKLQIQLRLVACDYHLGEFLNAAKAMRAYPLPQDPVWKVRFLLYRIYTAQQVSGVYLPVLNRNEIVSSQASAAPAQWTEKQWQEKIDEDFRQIWSQRNWLVSAPIEQENLILNLTDTDTKRIPTLFDFAVNSWIAYLQGHPALAVQPLSSSFPSYLGGQARLKETTRKSAELLHAQLLQAAAQAEGKNRADARLFWLTDFVLLPFSNSFVVENQQKALDNAVMQLRPQIAPTPAKNNWWNRLKKYVSTSESSQPDYARGYTAWQLASLLAEQKKYEEALQITHLAKELPPSYFTDQCQRLVQEITRIELSPSGFSTTLNRTQPKLTISGKNLKQVFVRVYKTSFDELYELNQKRHRTLYAWHSVTYLDTPDIPSFLARTPIHKQTVKVPYPGVGQEQRTSFQLPALEEGFYVVLMSSQEDFSIDKSGVFGWILNATDLAVFVTAAISGDPANYAPSLIETPKILHPNLFHIYTVNLRTGLPEPNTSLRLLSGYNKSAATEKTDKNGMHQLARAIPSRESYQLDVLAQKGNSTAYLTNPLYFSFHQEDPVKLFLQTDRPIYRPGQKIHLAVQALERLSRGFKTLSGYNVFLTINDPNGKKIFTSSSRLDGIGNTQTEFTLPENTLLGHYSVNASISINNHTYRAYHSFSIEEYKRPDYELTLNPLQTALTYGKKATLSGTAKYYFGAPMEKAKVTYTLKRRSYVPLFYWWWFRPMAEEKTIAQGQTLTDEKGIFEVSFIPTRQEEDEEFANYVLDAQVYDESGRTVSATRSYKISAHPHLFKVEFTQGFYDANKPTPLATINLVNADGESVSGKLTLTISQLENRLPETNPSVSHCYDCPNPGTNLDALYQKATVQEIVFKKQLSFQTPGEQIFSLPALPEGVYRLELTSEKATTQKMVFVVADEKSNLQLPAVALMQHSTYHPGETMRVLTGAGNLQGSKRLEIYQEDKFLIHQAQLNGGVEIFTWPVTTNHRGGLSLRWFGASNYQIHSAQAVAQVPFDNKKLEVQATAPSTVKPGQTVNWKVTAKSNSGRPVNGLVNVTVYDKSLDYYIPNTLPFLFKNLYAQRTGVPSLAHAANGANTVVYYPKSDPTKYDFSPIPLPNINLQMMFRAYKNFGRANSSGIMMMAKSAAPMVATDEQSARFSDAKQATLGESAFNESASAETEEMQPEGSPLRTDFSETAYFNSALPLNNGQATLRFILPQSLTTWNVLGFALTKQADFGDFSASFITRKDVMVRLQLPRFYREEDKGVIQAAITNQTEQKITAQVTLNIQKDATSALSSFGITTPTQAIAVAPNRTEFVSWDITAPTDPALYTVTAVARHGKESDGEQKTLPVLPGKMRLLAAVHRMLKNENTTLHLEELDPIAPRDVNLAVLTISPSLALSVLNAIPNLLTVPHKDLVSSLNRYVPLAVINKFYTTYPQLREAVKKLPKRNSLTPTWDDRNPLRLQLLEQTPWLRQAQGNSVNQDDIISLFDDKIVASYLEKELKNISHFQNSNGAFSWFAGGPADDYLTLYALQAFAQALAYKATIPESSVKKAINYITSRIEKYLKQDESASVSAVSYALYAAYTLSSFPAEWKEVVQAKPYIKRWADYADSQFKFMTPLGQIYAAAVYHRLGDEAKANKYLDLVLARLKIDSLTGAYFAPEEQSWIWYNDTLTTQTITLRTLLEMRPQSDKIDAMMQWLLFNRQVNDWTDSKAATQAVFTLLDVMQTKGALTTNSSYQITWGGQTQNRTFKPLDWTENLQFIRQNGHITPATYTARISRQGPSTMDFASLTTVYQSSRAEASLPGVINVQRDYFLREKDGSQIKLKPLTPQDVLHVGDEVEVHLTLNTNSAFEYVLLQDPKPAGFESKNLLSGWAYQNVSFYREEKEVATNFFINWLPRGTITLRYTFQPTVSGKLHVLPAQVQSMYAPQYGAHSASTSLTVEK